MKFIEKVQLFENSLFIIESPDGICPIICENSFEDAINKIEVYRHIYDFSKLRYIKLNIYNQGISKNSFRILPEEERREYYLGDSISLAKYAYRRIIYLATDLSEVYGEYFSLMEDFKEYDFDDCTFIFDYNILYGGFEAHKYDIFESPYDLDGYEDKDRLAIVLYKDSDDRIPANNTVDICLLAELLYVPYDGANIDECKTLEYFGCDEFEFLPSAVLTNKVYSADYEKKEKPLPYVRKIPNIMRLYNALSEEEKEYYESKVNVNKTISND